MKLICRECKREYVLKSHARTEFCCRSCMFKNKEWREKQSLAKKGKIAWNKGKPAPWAKWEVLMTPESRKKMAESKRGKPSPNKGKFFPLLKGKNNHNWMGNKVSYSALHHWIRRELGMPGECVYCGSSAVMGRLEWASVSHHATRDLSDYIPLCIPCHREYDKKARV